MAKRKRHGRAVERPDFMAANDRVDFAAQLELMEIYVVRGATAEFLDEETASHVKYRLQEAREETMHDHPDEELVLAHLENARDQVANAHPRHDMIDTLEEAVQAARRLF